MWGTRSTTARAHRFCVALSATLFFPTVWGAPAKRTLRTCSVCRCRFFSWRMTQILRFGLVAAVLRYSQPTWRHVLISPASAMARVRTAPFARVKSGSSLAISRRPAARRRAPTCGDVRRPAGASRTSPRRYSSQRFCARTRASNTGARTRNTPLPQTRPRVRLAKWLLRTGSSSARCSSGLSAWARRLCSRPPSSQQRRATAG